MRHEVHVFCAHEACVGVTDCGSEMSRSQEALNAQQEIEHSIHYT
jgi:hypothetical protein